LHQRLSRRSRNGVSELQHDPNCTITVYWADDELLAVPQHPSVREKALHLLLGIAAQLGEAAEMRMTMQLVTSTGESEQVVRGSAHSLAQAAESGWHEQDSIAGKILAGSHQFRFDMHRDFESAQIELGSDEVLFGKELDLIRESLRTFARNYGVIVQAPLQLTFWDAGGIARELPLK
jgi:hypothetical protein